MRALVISRFGGPDVFEERDIDRPKPAPGEVLVRVVCSRTKAVDTRLRANGTWVNLAPVPGYDVSGVVEAVGPEVSEFKPGVAITDEAWLKRSCDASSNSRLE